ncbi:cytochrome P450 [Micromonospora sp. NPDC050187]|uniref:cytochrome P450 n=1 Tax=Micromonospora sp. NPDC050187 TaxID=3364277 RepID=UPI00379E84C6
MTSENPYPLYGPEFKRCPYTTYQQLRDKGEVHPVEFPSGVTGWLVTGYDAAVRTLTDPRLGKNHDLGNDAWRKLAAIMPEPQHSQLQVHLLHQDPPKHTFMRRFVTEALNPRRLEALRPQFQAMADELLDDLAPVGHGDLVESFSAKFPFLVLSTVIGLPPHLARRFRREWCRVVQPVGPKSPHRAHYIGLLHGLQAYIAEVEADRRADPGDDLLSRLVEANDDGRLSNEELASMIFQLLVAGQEPMTNQINTAMVALLTHPEALERLAADPALLPRAAEELMRYDSAFELTTWRFFAEDSDLFGTRIPAGDSVIVSLAAANRDPARFERADELDLDRSPNPHIAFGHGIHFCPGAGLARTELQIALETILRRLPHLKLAAEPDELGWIPAVLGRGVERLPVTFTATP